MVYDPSIKHKGYRAKDLKKLNDNQLEIFHQLTGWSVKTIKNANDDEFFTLFWDEKLRVENKLGI